MARKCQVSAYEALAAGRSYKRGSDEVQQEGEVGTWTWRYHGKVIVVRDGQRWRFMDAGWRTYTTRERLNLALQRAFGVKLYQKDFAWYIQWPGDDGLTETWTGARSFVVA